MLCRKPLISSPTVTKTDSETACFAGAAKSVSRSLTLMGGGFRQSSLNSFNRRHIYLERDWLGHTKSRSTTKMYSTTDTHIGQVEVPPT